MLHKAISNLKNQKGEGEGGFTLIELLVVILIIGILAAIALPTFLGQSDKAKDSSAKSDARNLVSQVESCIAGPTGATSCDTALELPNTGLKVVDAEPAAEQVHVAGANDDGTYTAVAKSSTNTFFAIQHTASGNARVCGTFAEVTTVPFAGTVNKGGCKTGKW